jgi:transcriptional regulator with XRE-family HTH domain
MYRMGLTPSQLARQLGLTRQSVYLMLKDGGTLPPDCRVPLLAVLLGCSESELLKARGAGWIARGRISSAMFQGSDHVSHDRVTA